MTDRDCSMTSNKRGHEHYCQVGLGGMTTCCTLFTIVILLRAILYNNRSSRYMSVLLSYILISHGLDLSFVQLVHSFVSIIDGAENEIGGLQYI